MAMFDTFNRFFKIMIKNLKKKVEEDISNQIDPGYISFNEITDKPFSVSEVNYCIKKLKTGKSAGPDSISNEIINIVELSLVKVLLSFLI